MTKNVIVDIVRDPVEGHILVLASDRTLAWDGLGWSPIGGLKSVRSFDTREMAVLEADTFGFEVLPERKPAMKWPAPLAALDAAGWFVTPDKKTKCNLCPELITWADTPAGKKMPLREIEPGIFRPHFADCDGYRKDQ